jgi:nitrite reductase (NO-forming)
MKSTDRKPLAAWGAALLGCLLAARAQGQDFKPLSEAEIAKLPRVEQALVPPPAFPAHEQVDKDGFKVIVVKLTVQEKQVVIDDQGTKYWSFAYNGSIPGPAIVAHEGDYIEATIVNAPGNTFEHNVDFHAATGALGGGGLTHVQPGEQVTLRFRATRAGVFIYHCAPGGVMIPWHIVHGMSGIVMVLPRNGLDDGHGNRLHYDRAYYIGEQDFYLKKGANGKYKEYASAAEAMGDDLKVMETEIPSHVVFNGHTSALTGDHAMKATVGETVLIVHSSADRDTRPHLIGGHGDYVWERGKFNNPPLVDQETWFVAGGSAGAALYRFRQPGVYAYLSHNLIDAVLKGATAHFKVEGKWDDDLMKVVKEAGPIPQ